MQIEDDKAVGTVEEVFKGNRILTINANEIAKDRGVLNGLSWNTFKEETYKVFGNLIGPADILNYKIMQSEGITKTVSLKHYFIL